MNWWRRWHNGAWFPRLAIKSAILIAVIVLTLYPRVDWIPRWVGRMRNLSSVLDAQHPGLAAFEADVRATAPADAPPEQLLDAVQQVVLKRIPYAWDWDTWGVVDYLPTVDEALRMGREDCDGRAVVAASLLRRMGQPAELVSDVLHVWVDTPAGPTMNPTSAEKTLTSTATGTKVNITPGLLRNLGRGMNYGVGAFPLAREIILLATIALLTMQPRSSFWRRVSGILLLWIALVTIRSVGISAAMQGKTDDIVATCVGWSSAVLGWLVLAIRAGGGQPRSAPARPE
ncbi:MAG: transglutaminase domain-containing protein [Planctomycetes bacterium]|nr:transglutaminase domain-containing protein [Planctomycetota bacterium]